PSGCTPRPRRLLVDAHAPGPEFTAASATGQRQAIFNRYRSGSRGGGGRPMRLRGLRWYLGTGAALSTVLAAGAAPAVAHGPGRPDRVEHVLLLCVDGFHPQDLAWGVANRPGWALAQLPRAGAGYSGARPASP